MNKKYIEIVKSAHSLFWKHGFRRISIEEICRDSKVSKMTFYRHFPNKIELAKVVFDKVVEEGNIRFRQLLIDATTPEDFVTKLLLLKSKTTDGISKEFLQDFYSHPELGLKEYVEYKTKSAWVKVLGELRNVQKKGFIRSDINLEFFFQLVTKIGDIIPDETFVNISKSPQDLIMSLAKILTYGIAAPVKK